MTSVRENLGGGSLVAAGMVVMNATAYLFTVAAARILAPQEFGAVTALLGIILVGNVAALGLQAATARRLALLRDRSPTSSPPPSVSPQPPRSAWGSPSRPPPWCSRPCCGWTPTSR